MIIIQLLKKLIYIKSLIDKSKQLDANIMSELEVCLENKNDSDGEEEEEIEELTVSDEESFENNENVIKRNDKNISKKNAWKENK